MSRHAGLIVLVCAYLVTLAIGGLIGSALSHVATELCDPAECERAAGRLVFLAGIGVLVLIAPTIWAISKTFAPLDGAE